MDGAETLHVRNLLRTGSVNALAGSSLRGEYLDADLYIRPSGTHIAELVASKRPAAVPAGGGGARWTLLLSRQDEPIAIEPGTGDQDQDQAQPSAGRQRQADGLSGGVTDIDRRDGEADDSNSGYSDEDLMRTGGGGRRQ